MIAKATVITHGSNAVRYSVDKEMAEIVMVNHLPESISSSAMWARMMAHQQKFKEKLNRHHPLKNTSVRIELSPAMEESVGWAMSDWVKLANEYIREFDVIDLSKKAKRASAKGTNLKNTQYVVSLHHDSKGHILHLHINANRIDMDGNVNDAHYINQRAMMAANKIAERRGWVQAETKRQWNIDQITKDCISSLKSMETFNWNIYTQKLQGKGYNVMLKRDSKGIVVGYTIKIGNSCYKSSLLGHGRNLSPSRIETTWEKLHPEKMLHSHHAREVGTRPVTPVMLKPAQPIKEPATTFVPPKPDKPQSVICHHDMKVNGESFSIDIPEEINNILMNEVSLPDNVFRSTLEDVQKTALLLFVNCFGAATAVAHSCGGGGDSATSGWGRDKDEDDKEWARRCAQMAQKMHKRRSRGLSI